MSHPSHLHEEDDPRRDRSSGSQPDLGSVVDEGGCQEGGTQGRGLGRDAGWRQHSDSALEYTGLYEGGEKVEIGQMSRSRLRLVMIAMYKIQSHAFQCENFLFFL